MCYNFELTGITFNMNNKHSLKTNSYYYESFIIILMSTPRIIWEENIVQVTSKHTSKCGN